MVRFGTAALDLRLLSSDQLAEALRVQRLADDRGELHRRIGTICVELGQLSEEQVDRIIDHQQFLSYTIAFFRRRMEGVVYPGFA